MWRDLGAYRLAERASLYVEIIFGIQRHSSLPSGDGYSSGIRKGQFLFLKKHLRNEKSRADSPLQYYEDLQGLKSAVVGHARPPKDIGNQPPKTALPCRQTSNNPSMKLLLYLFIDPAFQDFGNSYRHLFLHDEMLPFVRAGTLFLNSRTREFVRERTLEHTC